MLQFSNGAKQPGAIDLEAAVLLLAQTELHGEEVELEEGVDTRRKSCRNLS